MPQITLRQEQATFFIHWMIQYFALTAVLMLT